MIDQGWALVISALLAGVASIIVALIQKFRKENRRDHGAVMDALDRVSHTMERVEGKVDSHIEWHLTGGTTNGRVSRRSKTGSRKAS
jgi:uncharacterized membrane-anchored protein YhcB (DUF1043 family)